MGASCCQNPHGDYSASVEAETTFIFQVELKDLGVVSKSLGISFQNDDATGWSLDQEQVIKELLEKFQLDKVAPVHVSIGGDHDGEGAGDLLPNGGAGAPGVWAPGRPTVQTFQSLVTSHAPREGDWCLAKNITKYLKGAVHYKFAINGDKAGMLVEAYSDAEYAADKTDRTSVTGGTTAERLGIIELLQEINVETRTQSVLHVSNLAAIAQIEGENTSGRAKHIDVRLKFVKDIVE
ncbi:hypothetical protein PC119_g13273 [Phytophthora cactorum]|nr:hypothetical protein PC119_g13273 [Phytophthora cactorum]